MRQSCAVLEYHKNMLRFLSRVFNSLKLHTTSEGMYDVTISCDSHIHTPNDIASIVAVSYQCVGTVD